MSVFGIDGIMRILSHFAFIYFAYWALQSLRIEQIFRKNAVKQIKMTLLLCAIVLGYVTSSFFLEVLMTFRNLTQQFILN